MLRRHWGIRGARLTRLHGGLNSRTWAVTSTRGRHVAKQVPASGVAALVSGAEVAASLAQAGLVTGAPLPALDGRLVVVEHGLALLAWVPGRELTGATDEEQRWMAETLVAVHAVGGPAPGRGGGPWVADWLAPDAPGVAAHRWLVDALAAAREDRAGDGHLVGPAHRSRA